MPVDDRLREAGRARAVQHPERVVERDALERESRSLAAATELVPGDRALESGEGRARIEVPEQDGVLDRRERREQLLQRVPAIEVPAAVAVPVDREQDAWLDLREPIDHAPGAEVRRAARPDSAERRTGEHRRDRLRDVRQIGNDRSPGPTPSAGRPRCTPPRRELSSGQLRERTQLGGLADRHIVVSGRPEDVLGEVDPGAREPLRPGHRARAEYALVRAQESTSNRSQIDAQKPSRSAVDHSHRAA